MRNKTKSSNTFPPPLPSSRAQFHSLFPTSSHERHRGMGNRDYGQFITCCLCRLLLLRGGLLTLFPSSSMGSLPQETALHKLLQCESFPQAAACHRLPQCGSLPWGTVLQEQATPAWVPHRVTSPASKPAPVWGSSFRESTGPDRSLLLNGLPMGSHLPSGIHLFQHAVSSMGYR